MHGSTLRAATGGSNAEGMLWAGRGSDIDPWSDLLGCHVGVRADVLRGMPVGIPAWQAKRLLHGAPQTPKTESR